MECNLGGIKPFWKSDITSLLLYYKIGPSANKNTINNRSDLCSFFPQVCILSVLGHAHKNITIMSLNPV